MCQSICPNSKAECQFFYYNYFGGHFELLFAKLPLMKPSTRFLMFPAARSAHKIKSQIQHWRLVFIHNDNIARARSLVKYVCLEPRTNVNGTFSLIVAYGVNKSTVSSREPLRRVHFTSQCFTIFQHVPVSAKEV